VIGDLERRETDFPLWTKIALYCLLSRGRSYSFLQYPIRRGNNLYRCDPLHKYMIYVFYIIL
jgi:hypothetical protein